LRKVLGERHTPGGGGDQKKKKRETRGGIREIEMKCPEGGFVLGRKRLLFRGFTYAVSKNGRRLYYVIEGSFGRKAWRLAS